MDRWNEKRPLLQSRPLNSAAVPQYGQVCTICCAHLSPVFSCALSKYKSETTENFLIPRYAERRKAYFIKMSKCPIKHALKWHHRLPSEAHTSQGKVIYNIRLQHQLQPWSPHREGEGGRVPPRFRIPGEVPQKSLFFKENFRNIYQKV